MIIVSFLQACRSQKIDDTQEYIVSHVIPRPETQNCLDVENPIWVVPNTHGTATGWLTGFAPERNYMVNNYVSFIDVADKSDLPFVFSEVPTAIALKNLSPAEYDRLLGLLQSGKASLTNAFAVEYDSSLSSGATNFRMGQIAQDWFSSEIGIRPDIAWYIDLLGVNPNISEYLDLLDIDLMVHQRNSSTKNQLYELVAPSGASTMVANVKSYAQWRLAFKGEGVLPDSYKEQMLSEIRLDAALQPELPFLWLIGNGDYSEAPEDISRLEEMITAVKDDTGREVCLGTTEDFQFSLDNALKSGVSLPKIDEAGIFSYNAFWVNLPQIKQEFRSLENQLVSTEIMSSLSMGKDNGSYKSAELHDAWWMVLLNADRALLWGAGSDDPFIGEEQWNVRDRTQMAVKLLDEISNSMEETYAFDPIGWMRNGYYQWADDKTQPNGAICEKNDILNQSAICEGGVRQFSGNILMPSKAERSVLDEFTGYIETEDLKVNFDASTGEIISILDKAGTPLTTFSNKIVWMNDPLKLEKGLSASDFLSPLEKLQYLGSSDQLPAKIRQTNGPLFVSLSIINTHSNGMVLKRLVRIPKRGKRIEFETSTQNVPNGLLVSARFSLPDNISYQNRGTPFGFVQDKPSELRDLEHLKSFYDHKNLGLNSTIGPAMGWSSHLTASQKGVAILDKGLAGRQWGDSFADILLAHTQANYRGKKNELLSGKSELKYNYAIVLSSADDPVKFSRAAKEYNLQPLKSGQVAQGFSMSDGLIIESVSRVNNEVRFLVYNASDNEDVVNMTIPWPHLSASVKGLMRQADGALISQEGKESMPTYEFKVAPQDAFILTLITSDNVGDTEPLSSWKFFVPIEKQSTLRYKDRSLIGHPPE